MNVSSEAMCHRRSNAQRRPIARVPILERTITSSVVDTYLRRPYDSWPAPLGAFLVPHISFPLVHRLYLLSAVRVSLGGLMNLFSIVGEGRAVLGCALALTVTLSARAVGQGSA